MSKTNSIFIDGMEYTRVLPAPKIGFKHFVEEKQCATVLMTPHAFDHVQAMTDSKFKASNGFEIVCSGLNSSALTDKQFVMHRDTFKGKVVRIHEFLFQSRHGQVLTKPEIEKIEAALRELASQIPEEKPTHETALLNYF